MRPDKEYEEAAKNYKPQTVKVLFLVESPPAYENSSRKSYFFFKDNPGSDVLFATLCKAVFSKEYRKRNGNKDELLDEFQTKGYWLVDAVEWPINRIDGRLTTDAERAPCIRKAFPRLIQRLNAEVQTKQVGIIIIKNLVHQELFHKLGAQGFNVLNDKKIGFPRYYCDRDTVAGIRQALRKEGYVCGKKL